MSDYDLLAKLIFAEADKTSEVDPQAVANVVMNRTGNPARYGNSMREVILSPDQFTGVGSNEWNKVEQGKLSPSEKKLYINYLRIARSAVAGELEDITSGADHYYNPELAQPSWGKLTSPRKVEDWEKYYKPTYGSESHKYFKETLKKGK